MLTARTDVVGSLLRPAFLLEAREQLEAGAIDERTFAEAEDAAVDEAIALQEEAGLEVVTDGEMRRLSFQSQLPAAVDGFGDWDLDAFLWANGAATSSATSTSSGPLWRWPGSFNEGGFCRRRSSCTRGIEPTAC